MKHFIFPKSPYIWGFRGLLLSLLIFSCENQSTKQETIESEEISNPRKSCNSIYYWKTTFTLSDKEREFLDEHQIKRMYIRYFDVYMENGSPGPEATIRFQDSIPAGLEIIPTVFIDNNLFRYCNMEDYPKKIVDRILVMSETNDVPNVREVQIDCDWTKTTIGDYYDFLEAVQKLLSKHEIFLSVTIRLHQLNMTPPPGDRGVLMCYNTGAVRNDQTRNSILTSDDVLPYSDRLSDYEMPLDLAYPTFSWAVWFEDGNFKALLRTLEPTHENLKNSYGNRYRVMNGFYHEGHYLAKWDVVRFEFSDFYEIMRTKKLLEHQLKNFSVIIYHLDEKNLSKYTQNEIKKIYDTH